MILLILLILYYILFSLSPIFVKGLTENGISIFTIVFFRFFIATCIELIIVLITFKKLQNQLHRRNIDIKFGDLIKQVSKRYFLTSNNQFLGGRPQFFFITYVAIILVFLEIPFSYAAYSYAGVAVSTIFINGITFIIISIDMTIKREEDFNLLKLIYMILLIGAIVTIAYSKITNTSQPISQEGIYILFGAIIGSILFTLSMGQDKNHARVPLFEEFRILLLHNAGDIDKTALFLRSNLKNVALHFIGAVILLPFCGILSYISPDTFLGEQSNRFLHVDLWNVSALMKDSSMLGIVFLGTVIPYFMMNYVASVWTRNKYGPQETWISIIRLIQPLIGLYIGYFIWQEQIRSDYIAFTTLFLISTIFIRFFQETLNSKTGMFFIKYHWPYDIKAIHDFLIKIKEIDEIYFLTGEFDELILTTVKSIDRLAEINKILRDCQYVKKVSYAVAKSVTLKKN